jgi:hypothetical protein
VTVALEGPTDQAVIAKLFDSLGLELGPVHICGGKGKLDKRLPSYNQAARHFPWLVLRDLDDDAPCASGLVSEQLPNPADRMCFRIVVHAVEGWLLADSEAMASFLAVDSQKLPFAPDQVKDPKEELLRIVGKSRRKDIREDFLPAPHATARVGPAYTARLIEFASLHWRPEAAEERSPSLSRCIRALARLKG